MLKGEPKLARAPAQEQWPNPTVRDMEGTPIVEIDSQMGQNLDTSDAVRSRSG